MNWRREEVKLGVGPNVIMTEKEAELQSKVGGSIKESKKLSSDDLEDGRCPSEASDS